MTTVVRTEEISDADPWRKPLTTALPPDRVLEALAKAARRGLLPGFAQIAQDAFTLEADAVPFPFELRGAVRASASGGSEIRFEMTRLRRMPVIFAVVIALTVWPGVWLTDSLLGTYWGAYGRWSAGMPWLTYAWYMPVTVIPLPWMWRSLARRSAAEARASAAKQREAVANALSG